MITFCICDGILVNVSLSRYDRFQSYEYFEDFVDLALHQICCSQALTRNLVIWQMSVRSVSPQMSEPSVNKNLNESTLCQLFLVKCYPIQELFKFKQSLI